MGSAISESLAVSRFWLQEAGIAPNV